MDDAKLKAASMTDQEFRAFTVDQFQAGRAEFQQLHDALAANTAMTQANIASTAELVEIFGGAKTTASAFAWLGKNLRKFAAFVYPFVLLAGAVTALLHGKWPKWGD